MNSEDKNLEWRKKYGTNVPEGLIKQMEEMNLDWDQRKELLKATVFISNEGEVNDSIGASKNLNNADKKFLEKIAKQKISKQNKNTDYVSTNMKDGRVEHLKYYDNGQLKEQVFTLDDKIEGEVKLFHDNGQLKTKMFFNNGRQNNGEVISYHPNGTVARKANLSNHTRNGKFTEWFDNENLKTEGYYVNNVCYIEKEWWKNGNLKTDTSYKDNQLIESNKWTESGEEIKCGEGKEEIILKIKNQFPKIKELELHFFADGSIDPWFEFGYVDGNEISHDSLADYVNLTENWISKSIFNCSKYPIINENHGCGGCVHFYLDENIIDYTVCYYNNPNDIDDLDYHEERSETI